jgi:hypothetical protein
LAVGWLAERYDDWAASREQRDRDDGENAEGEPWPLARPGRCLQSVLHIGSEDVEQGRIGSEFAERGRHTIGDRFHVNTTKQYNSGQASHETHADGELRNSHKKRRSFTQRIDRKLRVPFPFVSEPEGTLKRLFGAAFMVPSS